MSILLKRNSMPWFEKEVTRLFDSLDVRKGITYSAIESIASFVYDVGVVLASQVAEMTNNTEITPENVIEAYHKLSSVADLALKSVNEAKLLEGNIDGLIYTIIWSQSISSIVQGVRWWPDEVVEIFLLYLQLLTEQIIEEGVKASSRRNLNVFDFEPVVKRGLY